MLHNGELNRRMVSDRGGIEKVERDERIVLRLDHETRDADAGEEADAGLQAVIVGSIAKAE